MYNIIYLLLIVSYFLGIIQTIFGTTVMKASVEGLVWILGFLLIFKKRKSGQFGFPFLVFMGAWLASGIINKDLGSASFTFFKPYLYSYVIFLVSYNLNLSLNQSKNILRLLIFLVLLQLPAAVVKLIIVGRVAEKVIGTMGNTAGSLHLIFPLLVIGNLLGAYFFLGKRRIYIYLILFFILFGISGAKKGVPFYSVFLIFIASFLYSRYILGNAINPRRIILVVISGIAIFYAGVRLVPGLNQEKQVGGSFSIDYVADKTYNYSYYDETRGVYAGRFGGITLFLSDMFGNTNEWLLVKSPKNTYFGYGPSSFEEDNYLANNPNIDIRYRRIIPTGFLRIMFALGLFGTLGFVLFYGGILRALFQLVKNRLEGFNPYGKVVVFGALIGVIVFWLDFLTYTQMYTYPSVYVSFFFILGQILGKHRNPLLYSRTQSNPEHEQNRPVV